MITPKQFGKDLAYDYYYDAKEELKNRIDEAEDWYNSDDNPDPEEIDFEALVDYVCELQSLNFEETVFDGGFKDSDLTLLIDKYGEDVIHDVSYSLYHALKYKLYTDYLNYSDSDIKREGVKIYESKKVKKIMKESKLMKNMRIIKESLTINGRKPVSKKSIKLFSESKKALVLNKRHRLAESALEDLEFKIEVRVYGKTRYTDETLTGTYDEVYDSYRSIKGDKEVISLFVEDKQFTILIQIFNKFILRDMLEASNDFNDFDRLVNKWKDEGRPHDFSKLIKESINTKPNRRNLLKESLQPISGLQYSVFKKGTAGEGRGGMITQGIARTLKDSAVVNGERYPFDKYDFVGLKGF